MVRSGGLVRATGGDEHEEPLPAPPDLRGLPSPCLPLPATAVQHERGQHDQRGQDPGDDDRHVRGPGIAIET